MSFQHPAPHLHCEQQDNEVIMSRHAISYQCVVMK